MDSNSSNSNGNNSLVKFVDLVEYKQIDEIIKREIKTIEDLSKAVNDLYDLDHKFDIGKIQVRFLLGAMIEKTGTIYGEGTIDQISEKYRVSSTTLREARAFAAKLNCSPKKLREWIKSVSAQRGRVYWTDCQELIRSGSDPRVLGQEAMVRRLVGRVERVSRDAENLASQLDNLPTDLRAEHEGALTVMYENIKAVQNQYQNISKTGKEIIPRSEEYLAFLRGFPCAVSGETPVEAHHAVGVRSVSKKASDFGAVPLSSTLHKELHDTGVETFEQKYGISLTELALNYLHKFLTGQWLTQTLGENDDL